ncbi:MAG: DUF4407 domain-containing protein [Longimicrobiaceae bacterium]
MKPFFLFCSGADRAALQESPGDEARYLGIGASVLLTAILAGISGGYALSTVFPAPAAAALAVLWSVVIFNLDRTLLSGVRRQKHFALDLLYAAPRIAVAILLAVVIARPLVLKLFEREIQARLARMQVDGAGRDAERIRAVDAGRLSELRAANDRLNREVEAKRTEYHQRTAAWIGEREGTAGTGVPGAGAVLREKDVARREAERQLREVEARNLPLVEHNDREIGRLLAEQDRRIAQLDALRAGETGLLARLEAFAALQRDSEAVRWASLFITLLFVALETAPVVLNLLSPASRLRPYGPLREQSQAD